MSSEITKEIFGMHEVAWSDGSDRNRVKLEAQLFSSGPNRYKDASLTVDLSKRGPGGMHPGFTKAVSTWYDVFAMSSTNTKNFALMAIPNASADDFERPVGYDYSHVRFSLLVNGAGDIYRFDHAAGWTTWNEATNAAPFRILASAAGVGAAWTAKSLAGAICPHAHQYQASVQALSAAGGNTIWYVRPTGSNLGVSLGAAVLLYSARGAAQVEGSRFIDRVDKNQSIDYQDVNVNVTSFDIIAYFDPHTANSS